MGVTKATSNKKLTAAVVNPYLDSLGGGERYTLSFAQSLESYGYCVDIQWNDFSIKKKLESRFGIKISKNIRFVEDVRRGDGYDVVFWVSDGSIPILRSRNNFIHFQVPFNYGTGKTLLNKMKLMRVNKVICNSYFTKSVIDNEYGVESIVIYPPVGVSRLKPTQKKNSILYVGRYSQLEQTKNQHILIEVFRELTARGVKDWKLVLAGGADVGVGDYLARLRERATGFPIEIHESPPFTTLQKLYGEAKIFWTAAGYGVNPQKDPRKTEHFGITLVESMAAGCVPIAFNAGGHTEIVSDSENGYLWKDENQLLNITLSLINNQSLVKQISKKAIEVSKIYEYERFEAEVGGLLGISNL